MKTRPKQLLGSLPLAFELPALAQNSVNDNNKIQANKNTQINQTISEMHLWALAGNADI